MALSPPFAERAGKSLARYESSYWETVRRDLAPTNYEITDGKYKEQLPKYIRRLSDHIVLRLKAIA